MAIEIVEGDLLAAFDRGEVQYIGHCVNCKGVMGSGIAKSIKERYPTAYEIYRSVFDGKIDPRNLLGFAQEYTISTHKSIFNLFGQYDYGLTRRQVNYGAISACLSDMAFLLHADFDEYALIGFPYKMASDRAGGDWDIILEMIEFYFKDYNVKIYKLT